MNIELLKEVIKKNENNTKDNCLFVTMNGKLSSPNSFYLSENMFI